MSVYFMMKMAMENMNLILMIFSVTQLKEKAEHVSGHEFE